MFETSFSESTDIPLDTLLARLQRHPDVDALLLMGSSAARMGPTSDIDLLIVVDAMPVALTSLSTRIGGRAGDVYLMTTHRIDAYMAQDGPFDANDWGGKLVSWLRTGRIVYDRSGRLNRLAEQTYSDRRLTISEDAIYEAWYRVNYNLRHNQRLFASDDPLLQATVDTRLLFSLHELLTAYLLMRRIPWRGDRAAIDYIRQHDDGFWERYEVCLETVDRKLKFALYEALAEIALEPAGGVWDDDETAVNPAQTPTADALATGLDFWEQLVTLSEGR